jgi:Polysaccharide biosynthesis enzyme WcbI
VTATQDSGRRAHYGGFYGPPPAGPLALVHGNCQAEALRVLLGPDFLRMPPVHELTAGDLPHLHGLLARCSTLLSQPVRDGYRDLPLGTAELAARLPPGARVLRWPVIRHTGLHPYSAIVRHRRDMSVVPPVVPYHDLRTLAAASGRPPGDPPDARALREVGRLSVEELARRERDTDIGVSDLLIGFGAAAAHTLNHPGNAVLIALARRVQEALGTPATASEPGRELLGGIRAPITTPVVEALGLGVAPRPHWTVDGEPVADDDVRAAQLRWYDTHPQWVAAGLARHAPRMELLGLA